MYVIFTNTKNLDLSKKFKVSERRFYLPRKFTFNNHVELLVFIKKQRRSARTYISIVLANNAAEYFKDSRKWADPVLLLFELFF